ncbi:Ca2+-binding protein, RTX toxin-related [Fibrobacter sp. UWT3]|uniref:calcium-binding protein n=1 Tax=Fibrobacter sp. UWT3 TaxID=1896225 RepID=UPI000BCF4072|nr:calcium-binding protein [Fibrobacter sp. UWT3]SOE56056.1 Ca2+-binding protein, RTX toxin-related [Fibrobacter sp. UWT3]
MASNRTVFIWGGAGNDTIIGADGLNIIFGDIGTVRKDDDKYIIEANVDPGVAGNDIILGGSKKDIIFGGAGDDQIDGGAGADFIFGDGGRYDETGSIPQIDRTDISLDGGKDTLIGGDGDDVIYGGGGDDHIDGGKDKDEIYGEKGHDRIMGGSDDDTIHGGEGMDIVFGDRINNTPLDLAAPFAVGMSADKKTAAFSQEFIDAQFKNGTSASEDEFKIKLVDELNNPVKYAQEIKAAINDDNNDDFADYSSDLKTNGSDIIYGDDGNDLLFGDDGSDTNENGGTDKIYGGIGNDIIDGDGGNDTIEGGIDNDLIYGGAGDDIIDGGAGNDMLYGDNGVRDYVVKADDKTVNADKVDNANGTDKIVFGDNLGLHGELYANAEVKPDANGGNDKITTGPGMDFVDGQGGSDKITVKLMGDSTTNYTNVTDSGLDGSDTLVVEGTESIDRLLLRQNEKQNLGFVALLPITENDFDSEISETVKKNLNSNIERVNYTQGVEVLNVNANGGDDQVYIDGTAQTTNVDGGAGADKFYVGQLYNSDRVPGTSANIQPVDEFNATKTNEESYLSDGVSSGTKLNIEGGSGADEFVALNNVGALSMSGGRGDDTFSVYSFRKEDGVTPFDRGAMTIDGGKDTDTLNVRGTDAEDVFVVTKEGMLSDLVAIKAAGVESTQFDAAAGDDMFYVVGNKSTDVTELNGGKGNDTFSMGGLDKEYTLRSANTDGQTVDVKYEFVDANGVADTSKESLTESFTVVDSDSAPAVFIVENKGTQNQPDFEIQESYEVFLSSENAAPVSFFVGCAGLQNNQTLDVTISAPVPSTVDSNRGDRGFLVGYRKNAGGGIEWGETITVHPTNNTPVEVFVKALQDDLIEEGVRKAIAISSTWNNGSAKNVLTKSVTSVGLVFAGENRDGDVVAGRPLVRTEEFIIGASNEFKVNSIYVPQPDSNEAAANQVLSFYVDGVKQNWSTSDYNLSGNVVTINPNLLQAEKTLTICVRSNVLRVDDSKVYLAYEDMDIDSITIGKKTVCEYTEGCDRYYELNGNVITWTMQEFNKRVA